MQVRYQVATPGQVQLDPKAWTAEQIDAADKREAAAKIAAGRGPGYYHVHIAAEEFGDHETGGPRVCDLFAVNVGQPTKRTA
jgi:hypothetical protein